VLVVAQIVTVQILSLAALLQLVVVFLHTPTLLAQVVVLVAVVV
jgi:hypothetical protein